MSVQRGDSSVRAVADPGSGLESVGAVVLAGGRSTRLGGFPKPWLRSPDTTLLGLMIAALGDCGLSPQRIVVVGPPEVMADSGYTGIAVTREDPPFSGPVAGIAAGLRALRLAHSADLGPVEFVLTLACDMPQAGPGITALLEAACSHVRSHGPESSPDSWVGVTPASSPEGEDRVENLLSLHRASALLRALAQVDPAGLSVRRLLALLDVTLVALPPGSASDADTWEDAARLGLTAPRERRAGEPGT